MAPKWATRCHSNVYLIQDQSVDQLVRSLVCPSVRWSSVRRSLHRLVRRSLSPSVSQPVPPLVSPSVTQYLSQSASPSVGPSVISPLSLHWSVGPYVSPSVPPSVRWSPCHSVGPSIDPSVCQLVSLFIALVFVFLTLFIYSATKPQVCNKLNVQIVQCSVRPYHRRSVG